MRKSIILVAAVVGFIAGCKKPVENNVKVVSTGTINVAVSNVVDGAGIGFGRFTNASGNNYSVSLLKYYLSDFELISTTNDTVRISQSEFINGFDTSTLHFTLSNVKGGTYKTIRMHLGVPESKNHTGLQEGDLDPSYGMIWDWKTGYIFFKHEGRFVDNTGTDNLLLYHYGTDEAYTAIDMPVAPFEVNNNTSRFDLTFNINNLYRSPYAIDFNGNNSRQSTDKSDTTWLRQLKSNFPNCFTIVKKN